MEFRRENHLLECDVCGCLIVSEMGKFMNGCNCIKCGPAEDDHGRKTGVDLDLCDVCYWRKRAEIAIHGLRSVVEHGRIAGGNLSKLSTFVAIAEFALEKVDGGSL